MARWGDLDMEMIREIRKDMKGKEEQAYDISYEWIGISDRFLKSYALFLIKSCVVPRAKCGTCTLLFVVEKRIIITRG